MWLPFTFEILHFAICLFVALVLFATFWLYIDSWQQKKSIQGGIRCLGFLLLAFSFVVYAVTLESSVLQVPLFQLSAMNTIKLMLRNFGYVCILFGVFTERLQKKPKYQANLALTPFFATSLVIFQILPWFLSSLVTVFYALRYWVGLEAHLKPAVRAFFLFSVFELLSMAALLQGTQNITIFAWVAPFGPIWIAQHIVLFIAGIILGRWVFGYLLKQFLPQLFMILSTLVLIIFLITTTVFTSLLLKNVQDETLHQLENDVRVLQYALDSKQTEAITDAQMIAQNPTVQKNIKENARLELGQLSEQFLLSKKYSTLMIIDQNGQIISRGEDKENIGSFVADDPLVKRALDGDALSAFSTTEGVVAPIVTLKAVSPIIIDNDVVGVVLVGNVIDNTFVDGVKNATGLEASLYGRNILSATTLLGADNTARLSGITENNQAITDQVLNKGKIYRGGTSIGNNLFFLASAPLFDGDSIPVGMIFVGREQLGVFQTASRSIEITFIASVLMLLASIIPSYFISRYIARQL